jgi:hypothetical protein
MAASPYQYLFKKYDDGKIDKFIDINRWNLIYNKYKYFYVFFPVNNY